MQRRLDPAGPRRRRCVWSALALHLALATACASRLEPPPERGALARLLDLPPERRDHELAAFVTRAQPRLLLEVIPAETFEPWDDRLLPIGLDDFDILHVLVELDDPALELSPSVALFATDRPDLDPLPLYAPTRELLAAFTRERPAAAHTRYSLKSARLPWWFNLLTVGVLEIATIELDRREIPPDEEAQARATPWAQRIAARISPRYGCTGRSPCDRYYLVPRPRGEVPLRIELELQLRDTAAVRVAWSAPLPAGAPLAVRLHERFHGAPQPLHPLRVEPAFTRPPDPALCSLRERVCATPTAAPGARPPPQPPALDPPAQLASVADSLAARPAWTRDLNYAPAASLDAFDPVELVTNGPLRGELLVCDLRSPGGFNPDELVAELRVGAAPPYRPRIVRHADRARFIAPLIHLSPGERVSLRLWRRTSSWFWGVQDAELGRAAAAYTGALPLVLAARGLEASCVALGREGLERRALARLAALSERLEGFDLGADPITEGRADWGIGAWGMTSLQRDVEAIAGLVGWSDPRVIALLPALAHYHGVFMRHLGRLLARKRAQLPDPGTLLSFERGDLRVLGSACGAAIERKDVLWARDKVPADGCITILEVLGRGPTPLETSPRTGSLGALWSLELVWEDGRRCDAWSVGAEVPPGTRHRDREHPVLADGEAARFYLAPKEPYHRVGEDGPLFLYGLDRLRPVFVRLR